MVQGVSNVTLRVDSLVNWLQKGQERSKEGLMLEGLGAPGQCAGVMVDSEEGRRLKVGQNLPAASVVSSLWPTGHKGPPASKMQPLLPFQDGKLEGCFHVAAFQICLFL